MPRAGRLLSLLDVLRASYWFLPSLMAVASALAAVTLILVDRTFADAIRSRAPWLAGTEADGTRAVLSVIAGSMITVTGVVFSVTVVSLTLASSQFGPRLLRNFLRDRGNQFSFGAFVATFLFSLLVLRSVREDAVPHVSSAVAVLLAAASLFVLIYFIHHTASAIQASSVIAAVAGEIHAQLDSLFPEQIGEGRPVDDRSLEQRCREIEADGRDVTASRDGFIRVVDEHGLLGIARERDLCVVFDHRPGDFVFRRSRLARVGPAGRVSDQHLRRLRDTVVIGDIRSAVQDMGFLIGQLAETAVRALSPGVNDPRTAIDCTRRLGALIAAVANREMPARARHDDDGRLRVIAPVPTFEELVGSCLDPIRRYGGGQTAVAEALLDVTSRAGIDCRDAGRREVLRAYLDHVRDTYRAGNEASETDRRRVAAAYDAARRRLEGGGPSRDDVSPSSS